MYVCVSVWKNSVTNRWLQIVADGIMSFCPKDAHQIHGTCDYVVTWQRGIKVGMELRLLISWPWDDMILEYSAGSSIITRAFRSVREKQRRSEWCCVRRTQAAVVGFDDGGRAHEPVNAGNLCRLVKARKGLSPRVPRKECSPADTLILAHWDSFWTSDLQNCKIIYIVLSHKVIVIGYSSHRELIQYPCILWSVSRWTYLCLNHLIL